jgi:hypothetical protein
MTRLGRIGAKAGEAGKVSPASRLVQAIESGAKRGMLVELPVLGRAWVELIGSREAQSVDIAALTDLSSKMGSTFESGFVGTMLEFERALRILPEAVRDPDDHSKPFGTEEEWGDLDPDLVNAAWHAYGDVREALDPLDALITPAERDVISAAIAKKNSTLLRSFGAAKLSLYLLSMDAQPSTSPTPNAGVGESSLDS